jgi:squalene monooxygenase
MIRQCTVGAGITMLSTMMQLVSAVDVQVQSNSPTNAFASVGSVSAQTHFESITATLCSHSAALLLPVLLVVLAYWWFTHRSSAGKVSPSIPLAQTNARPNKSTDTDIVIIGAGVGGASMAAALGKRGYRVICVEQNLEEPHRIVGELLQPSGVQLLSDLGLPECLEGFDAQRVYGYGIFQCDTMLKLDYPRDSAGNIMQGRSFHNGRLLMGLRKAVSATRTAQLRQGKVTELIEENGRVSGVEYRTREGDVCKVTAALTVVCDGLFSSLNRTLTSNVGQQRSSFLGLILRDVPYPLPNGAGHVILADPTPILLYPISSNEGRMLIDFPPGTLPSDKEAVKKHLLTHTCAQLPQKLRDSFVAAVEEGWSTMPNRQMGARPIARPGTLLLGDALNVRHPLTGGGMTVAFTDVNGVVNKLDAQLRDWNDLSSVDAIVSNHYADRGSPVAAINILADALYDVFGCRYAELREACFSYLSQGGEQSAGPIRLLSGVSRSQLLLVAHFFSVALWGCARELLPFPTPNAFIRSFKMLRDANIIILPLVLQEHPSWPFQWIATLIRIIFWIPYRSYVQPRNTTL